MRVSRAEQQAVVERFRVALATGRVQGLMDVLAPDVVLIADGGGVAAAARVPIHGADLVAKLLGGLSRYPAELGTAPVVLNGAPALRIEADGELVAAVSLLVEDGRITRIYAMRNPHKLERLDEPAELSR
jgi:RNA polymerase sigma-70 factor (ECF subfamily)